MVENKRRYNRYFSSKKDYIDKDGWHIKGGGNNPYRAKRKFINKVKNQSYINLKDSNNDIQNSNIDNIFSKSIFDTLQNINDPLVNNNLDKDKDNLSRTNCITNKQTKSNSKVDLNTQYQLKFPPLSSRRLQSSQSENTKDTNMSWAKIIKESSKDKSSKENSSKDKSSKDKSSKEESSKENKNINKKFKKPIREKNTKASKRRKKKELEDYIQKQNYEKKKQEIINNISQSKKQD